MLSARPILFVAALLIATASRTQGVGFSSPSTVQRVTKLSGTDTTCAQRRSSSTWTSQYGRLQAGADVTIPCNKAVTIAPGTDIPRLGHLKIQGVLIIPAGFSGTLDVAGVLVQGVLRIGSTEEHMRRPFILNLVRSTRKLTLVRGGERFDWGTKAFTVAGGQVRMYGMPGGQRCMAKSWVRLSQPATMGSRSVTVDESVAGCWQVGQKIGIAPSYNNNQERETRTIRRIIGNTLYLDSPLKFDHTGNTNTFRVGSKTVHYTTEVGLLSRNIVIQSTIDDLQGFHAVVSNTARTQIFHGVEFIRGGQQGVLGRYPLHFHMCDDGQGSEVVGCSAHQSVQRGIIIHGTDGVKVQNNVLYDFVGHGIGFEDGVEKNNSVLYNLMIGGPRVSRLFSVDGQRESDNSPSCVWMRSATNTISGNVAAGCQFGFWYELEDKVRGPSKSLPQAQGLNPQEGEVPEFKDNIAHSGKTGLSLYPDGMLSARTNVFSNLLIYFNQERGIFAHNSKQFQIENSVIADCSNVGVDLDRVMDAEFTRSYVVGRSRFADQCPAGYGVELHPIRGLTNMNAATTISRVTFDGFQGCPKAPISVGNELTLFQGVFNRQQSLPSSTTLRAINFMDNPTMKIFIPQSKKDITDSMDSDWTSHAAIRVENSPSISPQDGFLISSNNDALPPPGMRCSMQDGSNSMFCAGSCYRTLELQIKGTGPLGWKLKTTRLSDSAVDYLQYPTWSQARNGERVYEFFGNFAAHEQYLITPIPPSGGKIVQFFGVRYDDGAEPACDGTVDVVFSQKEVGLSPSSVAQPAHRLPCPGSETSVSSNDVTYYSRCHARRGAELVVRLPYMFKMPKMFLHFIADRKGTKVSCGSGTITACRAIEFNTIWRFHDEGRQPNKFASLTLNANSWERGTGIFGYNKQGGLQSVISTPTVRGHTTVYFRKEFFLTRPSCYRGVGANPQILYDDGFVMYINGVEVLRKNLPSGRIRYGTYALRAGGTSNAYGNYRAQATNAFRSGTNVIAVEVHMADKSLAQTKAQKDLRFDMVLDLMYQPSSGC